MKKKNKIPISKYKRFQSWLVEMSEVYGVYDDPDVQRGIEILAEKLEKRIAQGDSGKGKLHRKAWTFLTIFKQKHLQMTDFEYQGNFDGKEVKITESLIEKLDKNDISVEEYVTWLFDDFFPDNQKLSPGIHIAVSNNVLQTYMYNNKNKLAKKKKLMKQEQEETAILQEIRVLMRETKDPYIVEVLENFKDNKINIDELSAEINKIRKKHQK